MKKIIAVLLLLVLALSTCTALAAETSPSVLYKGSKADVQFEFVDDDDLFDSFKNLLPGDEVTETITIRNDSKHKVRIYMHAETVPVESKEGFLNQLHLTVVNKGKAIFDNPPSENQPITVDNKAYLGTFGRNGGNTTLDVTLTIPFELSNDYQLAEGEVVWVFTVEELPEDDSPDTGDDFIAGLWIALAAALIAAIAAVLVILKRRRNEA